MLHNTQRTTSARDVFRILFRHRFKVVTVFLVTVALAVSAVLLMPRKYASETRLFLRLGRESVGIDPTATVGGQTISLTYSRESEIRSVAQLFESRVMFEQTVDQLGPDFVLEKDLEPTFVDRVAEWVDQVSMSEEKTEGLVREQAIRAMTKTMKIENLKKSHVFTISYRSREPERAQTVLRTYLDVCLKEYLRVHRNPDSQTFFAEQTDLLHDQVTQITQDLRDAKTEVGLVSLESQRKMLEDQITSLDREMVTSQAALASAEDRVASLRVRVTGSVEPASSGSLTERATDDMRSLLFSLQISEREMTTKFTPDHPKVAAIRNQVREAQEVLDRQEFSIQLSRVAELRAKVKSLASQCDAAQTKLLTLNEHEVRIADLERNLNQRSMSYEIYAKNLEQSRIDGELESDHITNISVAQSPSLVLKPLSRRGLLILVFGCGAALFGGAGIAFLAEYLDDSVVMPSDVESHLGLPVLMSVPRSSTHRAVFD